MILPLVRRFLLGMLTIGVISVLVFTGTEMLPGDVATAILGKYATPETLAAVREQLHLDRPAIVRYLEWVSKLVRGDLGDSLATGEPVGALLALRLRNTFLLAALTALFCVPIALVLGLLSAAYPESPFDRFVSISSLVAISMPEFFTAAVLVLVVAVTWRLFPAMSVTEFDSTWAMLRALALPILTLTAAMLSYMIRMTRAAVLDVLRSPYVEMAILKGVPKRRIVLKHALPNALAPVVNVIAINLGYLVSGVVIVEVAFNYPGLGRLMVDAVANRDLPLVQVVAMIFCVTYVGVNLIADLVAVLANPRLRKAR